MKSILIVFLNILAFFNNSVGQTIIPVDYKVFEKKLTSGAAKTQEEADKIVAEFRLEIKNNTEGKELPNLQVSNIKGDRFNLRNVLNQRSIIEISDAHCGFGKGSTTQDLPAIIEKLRLEHKDFDVICLVVKNDTDIKDSLLFYSYISELEPIYSKIFIISEEDSYKLNIFSFPVHLLIDKNLKVVTYRSGMAMRPTVLYNEINNFLKITE